MDKGYLKGEPTGVWDSQSADALRQFQTDQKLSPTGKINAPSIIALGLGPKNGEAAAPTTSKAAAQPVSPADGATGVVSNHDSAASPAVSQ